MLPVAETERDNAAAERATGVARIERPRLFPGGDRDEDVVVVRNGRARQARRVVVFDLFLPEQRAAFRLESIEPAGLIAEQQGMRRADPGRYDR